jgi:hypothetical protein
MQKEAVVFQIHSARRLLSPESPAILAEKYFHSSIESEFTQYFPKARFYTQSRQPWIDIDEWSAPPEILGGFKAGEDIPHVNLRIEDSSGAVALGMSLMEIKVLAPALTAISIVERTCRRACAPGIAVGHRLRETHCVRLFPLPDFGVGGSFAIDLILKNASHVV